MREHSVVIAAVSVFGLASIVDLLAGRKQMTCFQSWPCTRSITFRLWRMVLVVMPRPTPETSAYELPRDEIIWVSLIPLDIRRVANKLVARAVMEVVHYIRIWHA